MLCLTNTLYTAKKTFHERATENLAQVSAQSVLSTDFIEKCEQNVGVTIRCFTMIVFDQ